MQLEDTIKADVKTKVLLVKFMQNYLRVARE